MIPSRSWAAAFLLAGLATPGCGAPAPRIVCDEPVFEFGERFADEPPVVHVFRLRNAGNLTLEIGDLQADCGCTDTQLSSPAIRPGETAELTVTLSLQGRSGPQRKSITVSSNDPRQPEIVLTLTGAAKSEVEIRPMGALLGRIPADRETAFDVNISFPPERPNVVTGTRPAAPFLRAEVREIEARRAYVVTLRTVPPLAPFARSGHLQSYVRIDTETPFRPEILIPLVAQIETAVRVLPDRIPLPAGEAGPLTRFLLVRPGSAKDPRVEEVVLPDARMRHTVRAAEDGGERIAIEGIRPADLAPDAAIVLRVRHEGGVEEVRVPLVREP